MAIPVNSIQMGPLTAAASARVGNLGLEPTPIDIGAPMKGTAAGLLQAAAYHQAQQQALQKAYYDMVKEQYSQGQQNYRSDTSNANQAQIAAANRGNQMDIAQMNNATEQERNAIRAQYEQGLLGLKGAEVQGQLENSANLNDYRNATLQLEQQRQQQAQQTEALKQKMVMDDKSLNYRAAMGMTYLQAKSQLDPNAPDYAAKVQQLKESTLKLAQNKGILSADDAKNLASMPDDQFDNSVKLDAYMSSMAGQSKTSPDMLNNLFVSPGQTYVKNPDGSISKVAASKEGIQKAQENIQNIQKMSDQINNMINVMDQNPKMFQYSGIAGATIGTIYGKGKDLGFPELGQAIGSILPQSLSNVLNPKEAQFQDLTATNYDRLRSNLALSIAKSTSPFILRNQHLMESLIPSRSSQDYDSAKVSLQAFQAALQNQAKIDATYIQGGKITDPAAYEKASEDSLSQIQQQLNDAKEVNMVNQKYQLPDGTALDIAGTMKKHPEATPSQIIEQAVQAGYKRVQ